MTRRTSNNALDTREPQEESAKNGVGRIGEFEKDRNFVASFARGLEVIQSFYNESQGITAAKIARKTGFSRAAATNTYSGGVTPCCSAHASF